MGNYCCQGDALNLKNNNSPKKRVASSSTRSNDGNGMQPMKLDGIEFIEIFNSNKRVSMRPDFPQITHVQVVEELGKGAQADVFKVNVQTRDSKQRYSLGNQKATLAIKRINIQEQKKNERSIQLASQLLIENDCPFLMKGFFFFKNQNYFYEGMRYAQGGDLTSFIEKTTGKGDAFRKLGQLGIKIISAGIILGLQYLHNQGLIYCDLKPDNVLIGQDGYPMLADFELARSQKRIPTTLFEGTITAVGPEIYQKDTFDKSIDLWALGVVIYTLVYNQCPFMVEDILNLGYIEQCKKRQNKYKLKRKKVSDQLIDLVNKLLKCDPQQRIGYKSIQQIKKHPFFNNFNWQLYAKKQIENPISQVIKKFTSNKMTSSVAYG